MTTRRRSGCTFFCTTPDSPISRIGTLAVVLGLAVGCSKLGRDDDKSPTSPGPPVAGSSVFYDAVGASDVNGVGSSVVCAPFVECPAGMGYAQVATRQLKAQGFDVSFQNLGLATAVISPGFQALGQQYGRFILGNFIAQEMPFVRTNATLVTIFAGGNEVNTITAALGGGAGAGDPLGYIDAQVGTFGTDYTTLLNGIRARAPSARIVVLNVPNLAGFPFLTGASLAHRQAAQRAAVRMTRTVVNPLAAQGITVIDMMCDPRMYVPSNYSSDGFHPNDAGYAFIAGELVRAVTSRLYPAPQDSCSFMAVVPNL